MYLKRRSPYKQTHTAQYIQTSAGRTADSGLDGSLIWHRSDLFCDHWNRMIGKAERRGRLKWFVYCVYIHTYPVESFHYQLLISRVTILMQHLSRANGLSCLCW